MPEIASEMLDSMHAKLQSCMQRDRFKLGRKIVELAKSGSHSSTAIRDLTAQLKKSESIYRQRLGSLPKARLDSELPIFDRQAEIASAIEHNQVIIVSGETGSGKSTQLPLIALQLGFGAKGFIGHTQPRRIAARGVASRIANQLNSRLGNFVGFKIRFDDKTGDDTFVKLMTDGILLAETQTDRFLDQYEMLIIDEAHERSLNIDFLLGYLKRILVKRTDLKIVVTSATIDTDRFSQHFCDAFEKPAPVIQVEGRTYPVDIRYCPLESANETGGEHSNDHVVDSIHKAIAEQTGDVLVFLPTERDIKTVHKKLRGISGHGKAIDVLPLYARLSTEQQNAIFQAGSRRRIVLATNVAESSITVPGISIVIDSGTARISRYAPRSKVQRLPIEVISQASANQRSGRCGRIGPGVCLRLYSEEDFESRPKFTTPEIRRTNLASVILQTMALKLGDIAEFPFMEPPHREAIADGYKTLFEIGAVDDRRRLTPLGRRLARLPVDPRIGRMLFSADDNGCLNEVLIIASALEIQDPRVRPAEMQKQADDQHQKFKHEKSDFMSYLKLWDFFHKLRTDLSRSKFRIACQQNFLSLSSIHQWQEVHRQLKRIAYQSGLHVRDRKDDYNAIHRSLLTGLLSGVALLGDRHEYTGAGGIKFHLWPGSGVFGSKPKWIVAGELVETARRYGRTVAKIAPEWLEPIAAHLVCYNHVDPHWSKKRQTAMAYENVLLFGLPVVSRRRVGYAKIDAEHARQLFIESGIIGDQVTHPFKFLEHNRSVLAELEILAAKTRRRDWVVEPALLDQFYSDNLPANCVDVASLRKALKNDGGLKQRLRITQQDLRVDYDAQSITEQFPDIAEIGSMMLPLEYRFEPGGEKDGATLVVPRDGLNQINELQTEWLVPGLNEQRVAALIKSLPKSIRRNFVPVPETAKMICQRLVIGEGGFFESVARELTKMSGQPVDSSCFDTARIDECLRVNLVVLDNEDQVIAQGRSINELRKQVGCEADPFISEQNDEWNQDGLTSWTWGAMPDHIILERGVANVKVFPAIVDQQQAVGLRLVDKQETAAQLSLAGVRRLFVLAHRKSLRRQINWLPDLDQNELKLSSVISSSELRETLKDAIANIAFVEKKSFPQTKQQFEKRNSNSVESIAVATQVIAAWLPRLADAVHESMLALEQLPSRYELSIADIRSQVANLTDKNFLTETPWQWLEHFPRYFLAIKVRCDKLERQGHSKDLELAASIEHFWSQYEKLFQEHKSLSLFEPALIQFRWMVEEYRVSQFAQKLGTMVSVSPKRLSKQLELVSKLGN